MNKINKFDEVKYIQIDSFKDKRGYFSEIYNKENLLNYDIDDNFIQDNESFSLKKYTLRGLHFQTPPYSQSKLIRVIRGSILDIYVDIRKKSKNYLQYGSVELNQESGCLYIPSGFAHGFITLDQETLVTYKVNRYYNKGAEMGIIWNDPALAIDWPVSKNELTLSENDRNLPLWSEIEDQVNF